MGSSSRNWLSRNVDRDRQKLSRSSRCRRAETHLPGSRHSHMECDNHTNMVSDNTDLVRTGYLYRDRDCRRAVGRELFPDTSSRWRLDWQGPPPAPARCPSFHRRPGRQSDRGMELEPKVSVSASPLLLKFPA